MDREYCYFRKGIDAAVHKCLSEGSFILRDQVNDFEMNIGAMLGNVQCIGVNSGTDALNIILNFAKIPKGSEIIVSSHTFVSTITAVTNSGHVPVFCDIDINGNMNINALKKIINKNTKGILVTHMNGLMIDMGEIVKLADQSNLIVFEDAAQAFGSTENGRPPGALSSAAAFSLHPLKTLSVAGDGGFIVTKDEELAIKSKAYRNLGQLRKGFYEINGCNSRLDNIQAAIANVKLAEISLLINKRKYHASNYINSLKNIKAIKLPDLNFENFNHTFSNFVINVQNRNKLAESLLKNGVEVMIHWQPAVFELEIFKHYVKNTSSLKSAKKYIDSCLSIPISPWMYDEERNFVVSKIKEFYEV